MDNSVVFTLEEINKLKEIIQEEGTMDAIEFIEYVENHQNH